MEVTIVLRLDPLQEAITQRALLEFAERAQKRVDEAAEKGHRASGSEMARLTAANLVAEIRTQHQTDVPACDS